MSPEKEKIESLQPLKNEDETVALSEVWQAEVLALANHLIETNQIDVNDWSSVFEEQALKIKTNDQLSELENHYFAVLATVEILTEKLGISKLDRNEMKADWETAFRNTPHGKPVILRQGVNNVAKC